MESFWRRKKGVICLVVFLLGSLLLAQETGIVMGSIRDESSMEAMLAVNISANHRQGTISDNSGAYSLKLPPGKHTIEFYYVGYETVRREIELSPGSSVTLDVTMKVKRNYLDEVVVSAGKFEQKLSDVTVSMDLIKPHQLSSQNSTSLDMILEKTPGFSILNGQPSIRGGSGFSYGVGSRVLMLVDDLPMISGDAGDIKWSYMPVENINQVEVIKGASSVLYGSSALNGVVNLRTRFPETDPITEATVFSGMYMKPKRKAMLWWDHNPLFYGATFNHLQKVGNLDLSLGANYFRDEAYRELEHEHRLRGSLGLRYKFREVPGLSAGISGSYMYTDKADFILWQDADSGAYRQNPDTYARLFGHRYNIDPYIEYYTKTGSKHTLKTRLYSVGNNTIDSTKNSFSKVWFAEYRYSKKFRGDTHWTSGFSFMRNTVVAGLFNEHKGSNTAVYSQLDAYIWKKLKVSVGLRWEINGLNEELFLASPVARAGLNYQAGKATYIRGSFGQGYRFPSVAEKFVDAQTSGIKIFPNPELEAEWGWSAELGMKQGFLLGAWSGIADLALFWTRYQNMIEYTFGYYPPSPDTPPSFNYVGFKALNVESARIAGFELSISAQGAIGPVSCVMSGGYTYMDPVDPVAIETDGRTGDEAYVLNYRRHHLFKSDLELGLGKVFAGANLQYNSRMINVDIAFTDPSLGNLLLPGFPDYWINDASGYVLLDLRLGWHITPVVRLNLLLKNATNKEYLGRPGDIGPPRNISLQCKLTF